MAVANYRNGDRDYTPTGVTNVILLSKNRYQFLYQAHLLPLLKQICSYLDKFTISKYKKGLHKDESYITLPHEEAKHFNKLLDDTVVS